MLLHPKSFNLFSLKDRIPNGTFIKRGKIKTKTDIQGVFIVTSTIAIMPVSCVFSVNTFYQFQLSHERVSKVIEWASKASKEKQSAADLVSAKKDYWLNKVQILRYHIFSN